MGSRLPTLGAIDTRSSEIAIDSGSFEVARRSEPQLRHDDVPLRGHDEALWALAGHRPHHATRAEGRVEAAIRR